MVYRAEDAVAHLHPFIRGKVVNFLVRDPLALFLQSGCDVQIFIRGGISASAAVLFKSKTNGLELEYIIAEDCGMVSACYDSAVRKEFNGLECREYLP